MSTPCTAALKVCFFNRSYWPDMAATGQLLTELAEDLVTRDGCDVSVVAGLPLTVAAFRTWWPVSSDTHAGVRIVRANGTRLPPRRFSGRVANYLTYCLSAAVASIGLSRLDVVVSLTDPPIVGLLGLATARRLGAKFVFLCEDIFPEVGALVDDFHNDTVNRTLDRANRYLLAHADAVVALGSRMKRRLVEEKGADPGRVTVIHNWADCEAIRPTPKDNTFSRAHGLVDKFVVMHSGNVGLSQDLAVLVEAAARLRHRPDVVFAIVGDGAKRSALEASVAANGMTNVRFFPYQSKDRLNDSFGTADVFIVSLAAGLEGYIVPSKLYGILAAGRPFIGAVDPSAEVAEIAREYGCGLLAAPGNAVALADAVLRLAGNQQESAAMGRRARDAAWQFDRRRATSAYYDLLARLAGSRA